MTNHIEETPAGVIDWKMEVERLNRLLAAAEVRSADPAYQPLDVLAALRPFATIGLDVLKEHPGWANRVFSSEWAGYRITYVDFERAAAVVMALTMSSANQG